MTGIIKSEGGGEGGTSPSSARVEFLAKMEDLINFSENGAENLEIRKEEVVTPKEDDTSPEQYERLNWMILLEQEVARTKMALELLLRDKGEVKDVRRPVRSLVKLRDILMLNLSDLQGIEAEGRLNVFFSQVESCSWIWRREKGSLWQEWTHR
ncbi:hypothetical protein GWK47_037332 [Chionoecetes opilio]|uniref:Uncharacterized protein n=1 Tax=Chionoecetes opilio TaxID=41210 RepID=A0A8J4YLV0_CHIOP|nr:hypothetical protein GWK47_037332 [Chionoecetes opilio]